MTEQRRLGDLQDLTPNMIGVVILGPPLANVLNPLQGVHQEIILIEGVSSASRYRAPIGRILDHRAPLELPDVALKDQGEMVAIYHVFSFSLRLIATARRPRPHTDRFPQLLLGWPSDGPACSSQ